MKGDEEEPERQPFGPFGMKNTCINRYSGVTTTNHRSLEPEFDDKVVKKLRKIKSNCQKPAKKTPTHLVDIIARFLFPFTYGLFNFIYWWTQLD